MAEIINGVEVPAEIEGQGRDAIAAWAAQHAKGTAAPADAPKSKAPTAPAPQEG